MPTYRHHFPIFAEQPDLAYLDSASTTQKPAGVIKAVASFSGSSMANVHRGMYPLAVEATAQYEAVRDQVAAHIGAKRTEVIFTRSTTDGLNMISGMLSSRLTAQHNVILSVAEHHANLIPWQQIAHNRGTELRFAEIDEDGRLNYGHLRSLIDANTAVVSLSHCSNVLGSVTDVNAVKKMLLEEGSESLLIIDAAQSIAHFPVSVSELGCDVMAFSSHKLYGPSGVGVLWGREKLLNQLPPYQTGGEMIRTASLTNATWNDLPWKFEAGTPNIEGVIGFGAALRLLNDIGMAAVEAHIGELAKYAMDQLKTLPDVRIVGQPDPASGIISFAVNGLHPHDLAELLGQQGICIRAGHHCAAPLHAQLDLAASNRISLGIYNERLDIDRCVTAMNEIISEVKNA